MGNEQMSKKKNKFVYVPKNAKLNYENKDLDPPPVEYENRKVIFNRKAVKKVVGGKYGRDEKN